VPAPSVVASDFPSPLFQPPNTAPRGNVGGSPHFFVTSPFPYRMACVSTSNVLANKQENFTFCTSPSFPTQIRHSPFGGPCLCFLRFQCPMISIAARLPNWLISSQSLEPCLLRALLIGVMIPFPREGSQFHPGRAPPKSFPIQRVFYLRQCNVSAFSPFS